MNPDSLEVAISTNDVQLLESYNKLEIKPIHFEMATSVDMLKLLAKLKFGQNINSEFSKSKYGQFLKRIYLGISICDEEFIEMLNYLYLISFK